MQSSTSCWRRKSLRPLKPLTLNVRRRFALRQKQRRRQDGRPSWSTDAISGQLTPADLECIEKGRRARFVGNEGRRMAGLATGGVARTGRMCELMKRVSGHSFQIMPDRPRSPQWPTSQRSIDAPPSSAIMVTALGNWRAARRPTRPPPQRPVRGLDPRGPETRRSACSIPVLRCHARSESCGRCRRRGLRSPP